KGERIVILYIRSVTYSWRNVYHYHKTTTPFLIAKQSVSQHTIICLFSVYITRYSNTIHA
ncbi:hypothetical protein ACXXHH_14085, partial [Staphylococcus epidermidis]